MRSNLLKSFIAALAGSTLLLVAMFALVAMRPEATTVQAAPAFQAPVLAATKSTTATKLTVTPDNAYVGEKFEIVFQNTIAATRTAKLSVSYLKCGKGGTNCLPIGTESVTDTKVATYTKVFTYPGAFKISAVAIYTDTTNGNVEAMVNVYPKFAFDDKVKGKTKLGTTSPLTVWVEPAAPLNQTEIINFQPGGSVKVVTGSNIITKTADKTGVYTSYIFTAPGVYPVTATYESGVYAGGPKATSTITVEDASLTLTSSTAKGKCGDVVTLTAKTDATFASKVEFKATSVITTPAVKNGQAVAPWTLPEVTTNTIYLVTATLKSDGDKFKTKATQATTVTVTCPMKEEEDVPDALTLDASDTTVPVKGSITFTATIKKDGEVLKQAGRTINFKTTAGTLSGATGTTNADGQAKVTLTSATPTTATVTATDSEVITATASQSVAFVQTVEQKPGTYPIDNDHSIEFTGTPSITGKLRFPFCIKVVGVPKPSVFDKLPSIFKSHAFFEVMFFNITNNKCDSEKVTEFKIHSKARISRKFIFGGKSQLAQISTTLPISANQASLVHLADTTSGILDTTVTVDGTTGEASAAISTAETFALATGNNLVYLPTISRTSTTTSTLR